jgi:DNA primase
VFKAGLLMAECGEDPVKKAAAIHEIVESVALVPDLVLRSLYVQQCSRMLAVNEQALISEMNKVLRRKYRKDLGEGAYVPEEQLAPDAAPPQPEVVEELGTSLQERELLRMLLKYGPNLIHAKYEDDAGAIVEEDISVAEYLFELLAHDDLLFDHELFNAIYLDYRHRRNLGESVGYTHYIDHGEEQWKQLVIDLLAEKYLLSQNWKERHKIHVKTEDEELKDLLIYMVDLLKLRRVQRILTDLSDAIRTASYEDCMPLMKQKIHYEEVRGKLAQRTGRLIAV